MKLDHLSSPAFRKAPSGITGFDEITGGGLSRGRTTLLLGGPGSGKTVFALQYLINGVRIYAKKTAVRIAVNVSPMQLRNRDFVAEILQAIGDDPMAAAGLRSATWLNFPCTP
jgi:predicted ATP-dependent serine protease